MTPIHIVLVDDHASFRTGIRRILATYPGLEVVGEAGSADDALSVIKDIQPDVVLMDIDLKDREGGIMVTKQLVPHLRATKIILLSGLSDHLQSGLQAGARGYVTKDDDENEIVAAIHTVHAGGAYVSTSLQGQLVDLVQRDPGSALTARELDILKLAAQGKTNAEIGTLLGISKDAVKQGFSNITAKLNANDRTHAVVIALRQGELTL